MQTDTALHSRPTLGDRTSLDLDRLIHLLLTASTGAGKSSLLRLLLERTFGAVQQLVLDWEGEFWTLRERGDYVLVGRDGDIPADPAAAELLGRRLLELGFSCIVDLSELKPHDRLTYARDLLTSLLEAPREQWRDLLIVVDEAHHYAPEELPRGSKPVAKEALVDLASRGRKRGYKLVVATQRLSKLDKDVAGECQDKLVGRTNLADDRARAIKELAARSRGRELEHTLATLQPGHFLAMGDALGHGDVTEVHVHLPQTKAPPRGAAARAAPAPRAAVLKVLEQLRDLPQQAEEQLRTREALEAEVARLRGELDRAQRGRAELEQQLQNARPPLDLSNLRAHLHNLQRTSATLTKELETAVGCIDGLEDYAARAGVHEAEVAPAKPAALHVEARARRSIATDDGGWGKCERAVLVVLAQHPEGCSAGKLALLSGYRWSGGFRNALAKLRTAGLLEGGNQDVMRLTVQGRAAARDAPPLPAGRALIDYWLQHPSLGKAERATLSVLVKHYPGSLSAEELTEFSGYEWSGGFRNALAKLRTAGLLEGGNRGKMRASQILMGGR